MKKSEITKEKILTTAENEFSEKGLFGARIDVICEKAGVNKRMIYHYFHSKEELYKTVLYGVYEKLAEYEKEYYIDVVSPDLAIKNIVYGSFRFLKANPTFVRILMWENLNNGKYLQDKDVKSVKNPTIEYIKSQIVKGQTEGIFREDVDKEQIVISLLNFEFSYFSSIYTLSNVLEMELFSESEIAKRADFISGLLLKYLYKD